jgi:hypothetical protein
MILKAPYWHLPRQLWVAIFLFACYGFSDVAEIRSGVDVLIAMHSKYEKSWYKTATFTQKSTTIKPDGSRESVIWYEAVEVPGKLRIDVAPRTAGNGRLFVGGKLMTFKDGKFVSTEPFVHPLLVLGFDVYRQPVETTVAELKPIVNLQTVHRDTWQGRPVYVVGAAKGDLRTAQFWVDKERLLFVRLIRPNQANSSVLDETQFNNYKQMPVGGWISAEVLFISNGKPRFEESYSDIRVNVPLSPAVFDSERWSSVHQPEAAKSGQ